METITKRLILDNPKISRDELIKKYLDIIHIYSGITYSETYSKMYNSDGTIALDNLPDIPPQKCGSFSGIGRAANYMFYKWGRGQKVGPIDRGVRRSIYVFA